MHKAKADCWTSSPTPSLRAIIPFICRLRSRDPGRRPAKQWRGRGGPTLVVVRDELLGRALPICPSAFDYQVVADNHSMFNTPPTYAIYMAGLIFQWMKREGGVAAMEARNIAKARLMYDTIDQSGLYENRVAKDCRSRMNIPFYLRDESRSEAFLAGARTHGLLQLKGHKSVGGMRASLYNAMPLNGVQALVDYMREFERSQS